MKNESSSQTAEYMAFFRAIESNRPRDRRLFADDFAMDFLRPSLKKAALFSRMPPVRALVDRFADWRLPGARTSAIARTRFIDDLLSNRLSENLKQLVILGAGFDCRAYRMPSLRTVSVFEVDHPATLRKKLGHLEQRLPKLPGNVRFVPIDFNQQRLCDVLRDAGLRVSLPTIFLWEGVTNYLTANAVDAVLRYVAAFPAGSRLIFTYVHSGALAGSDAFQEAQRLLDDVAQLGEPWTFGLDPAQLSGFLQERSLHLDEDLSATDYRSRYFGDSSRRMKGYEFYHVAVAQVCPAKDREEDSKPDA